MRWPQGPPHLALNPPYFFGLFCLFFLCFLCVSKKNLVLPLKRAILFILECLPLFLLSLFWPPPFSLSLSLSLSCPFLTSFLSFFSFLCLFLYFFSSLPLFHEKNDFKIFYYKAFLPSILSLFCFLSCFLFEIPFYYLCFATCEKLSFLPFFWQI